MLNRHTCHCLAAAGACVLAFAGAARAAEVPVDLELILAVDVSGSVDNTEARLQRDGYIAAITNPTVIRTIGAGYRGAIAATYVEWAGTGQVRIVAEWQRISDAESARVFADAIGEAPMTTGMWTSISGLIDSVVTGFENNGFKAPRRVIDISGDGANNHGRLVTLSRDEAQARGITINGLPIVNDRLNSFGQPQIHDLDLYFRHCVIGGPGAFLVVAEDFKSFGAAIRRKLILEIAGHTPPPGKGLTAPIERATEEPAVPPTRRRLPDGSPTGREPPPCDIGEMDIEERLRSWKN